MKGDCVPEPSDPRIAALEAEIVELRRENNKMLALAREALLARMKEMPKEKLFAFVDAINAFEPRKDRT